MLHQEIDALPEGLRFLPVGEAEMRKTPDYEKRIFVRRSERVWALQDENGVTLVVAGIIRRSDVSVPELWILMCADFKTRLRKNLAEIKLKLRELLDLYDHVRVRVDASRAVATRFAEYMGFTEYHRDEAGYVYYEVRR